MTDRLPSWLPKNCFTSDLAEAVVADALGIWAGEWLGRSELAVGDAHDATGRQSMPTESIIVEHGGVVLSLAGRGKRMLLELAFKHSLRAGEFSPTDHKLLDAFSFRLSDALGRHLADHFKANAATVSDDHQTGFTILHLDEAIWQLRMPSSLLTSAIIARVGGRTSNLPPLQRRSKTLGATRVTLSAVLGNVALTVKDVEELAIGDVLILDRSLDNPVEIRIQPGQALVSQGTLETQDNRIAIRI